MKEVILTILRIIVLIFLLASHFVRFLWSGMLILPITLLDLWITTLLTDKVFSKKMFRNAVSFVFEGDAIFDMIKWMGDD